MQVIQVLFLLCFPIVIIWGLRRYPKVSFLSPVLLCYLLGMIVANFPFVDAGLSETMAEISIPMAIPLLLFSTHFSKWLRLARKTLLSFILILFSAMVSAFGASMIFAAYVEDFWKVGGMLVGVYTGGTPNMMAVGLSLDVPGEVYTLVHTADVLIGGLYIVFLMFAGKALVRLFLPEFQLREEEASEANEDSEDYLEDKENKFRGFSLSSKVQNVLIFLGLAAIILGIAVGLSLIITGELSVSIVMLIVTTLGIACSFVSKIREAATPYTVGHYLLLVFSLAIGSTIEIEALLAASQTIVLFTATAMLGAILIHLFLAFLFRIDTDTTLITSTAAVYGPPFVVPVAAVLKNKELLVPGLLCGLVGYAFGNYLGLLMASFLAIF